MYWTSKIVRRCAHGLHISTEVQTFVLCNRSIAASDFFGSGFVDGVIAFVSFLSAAFDSLVGLLLSENSADCVLVLWRERCVVYTGGSGMLYLFVHVDGVDGLCSISFLVLILIPLVIGPCRTAVRYSCVCCASSL